jgi:hypothetical protein
MYTVNIVRYGQVVTSYSVKNIRLTLAQLAYLSVSNEGNEGNVYNVIMAVKDDCDITTLATGNVGIITKGLA